MSVSLYHASAAIGLATEKFAYNSPYTIAFWWYMASIPSAAGVAFPTIRDIFNYDDIVYIGTGPTLQLYSRNGANTFTSTGNSGDAGQWIYWALVRSSATLLTLYRNNVSHLSIATDVSTRSPTTAPIFFGGNANTMIISNIKIWTAALSTTELADEMKVYRPVHQPENLWAWYPLTGSSE